jgi:hypothetical protein
MKRYTFVIQVHPDGISTLENLATHERVQVSDLATVGPQIQRWLGSLPSTSSDSSDGQWEGGRRAPGHGGRSP